MLGDTERADRTGYIIMAGESGNTYGCLLYCTWCDLIMMGEQTVYARMRWGEKLVHARAPMTYFHISPYNTPLPPPSADHRTGGSLRFRSTSPCEIHCTSSKNMSSRSISSNECTNELSRECVGSLSTVASHFPKNFSVQTPISLIGGVIHRHLQ